MSEQSKGSLLLPLGIGAGLLLLYFGMKKKEAVQAPPEDPTALLPEIKQSEAAVPQIDPAPAPSYTQVARTTDTGAGEDDDPDEANDTDDDDESGEGQVSDDDPSDDEDDSSPAPPGGNSFISSQRSTPPPASRQLPPAPAYVPPASNTTSRKITGKAKYLSRKAVQPSTRMVSAKRRITLMRKQHPGNMPPTPVQQIVAAPAVAPGVAVQQAPMPFVSITTNTNVPPATAAPVTQAAIFPLKFGTTSPYVKEAQRRLGVPATGYFGAMTRSAIQRRFKVREISEALYKQIITGRRPLPVQRKPVTNALHKKKAATGKFKVLRRK